MNISVIGCGRWGAFIAWYLDTIKNYNVTIYGREHSEHFNSIRLNRGNELLSFSDNMSFTGDLLQACSNDTIIISISSQSLRALCKEINNLRIKNKTIVLCMKGLEIDTGKRLTEILQDELYDCDNIQLAVWLGPGHVQDFTSGIPGCMVIDSYEDSTKQMLVNAFSSNLIRFYYGNDIIGNEVGGAIKNVIGIAAGMLDGMNVGALKGALTTRGTFEVSKLINAMGGNPRSAYGLCHLGDYSATVFSEYSNNRRFGEAFIKGETFDKLAEGYYTVKAVVELAKRYSVQMPICEAVYDVLYNKANAQTAIKTLMSRDIKQEI